MNAPTLAQRFAATMTGAQGELFPVVLVLSPSGGLVRAA
jgi:hypothetical protein